MGMLLACWGGIAGVTAQKVGELHVENYELIRHGNQINVSMFFDGNNLHVPENKELKVQPVLVYGNAEQDSLFLPYMLFTGDRRERIHHRERALGNAKALRHEIYSISVSGENVTYYQSIPYNANYFHSRLVLKQELNSCADCSHRLATIPLDTLVQRFRIAYLIPEPLQESEKRISLDIQFPLNNDHLVVQYANNDAELHRLVQDIREITDQPHLKLTGVHLTGYASPEGNYDHNAELAYTRAHVVRDFLASVLPEERDKISLDFTPEDWEGLYHLIERKNSARGRAVRQMLDETPSPVKREERIRKMVGATAYRQLLQEAYPRLRRVDCRIRYRTDTEADKIRLAALVRENPDGLQVHDYFIVAADYRPGTPEFHKVMEYAHVRFPENDDVVLNKAAYALQTGDIQTARELIREDNRMEGLNNRAVLLFLEGDWDLAMQLFREAEQKGSSEAGHNLREVLAVND